MINMCENKITNLDIKGVQHALNRLLTSTPKVRSPLPPRKQENKQESSLLRFGEISGSEEYCTNEAEDLAHPYRPPRPREKQPLSQDCTIFVIMGASGKVATHRVYPALWSLFAGGLLPPNTRIIGYDTGDTSVGEIRRQCESTVSAEEGGDEGRSLNAFWDVNGYAAGSFEDEDQTTELATAFESIEENFERSNRVFILTVKLTLCNGMFALISKAWVQRAGTTQVISIDSLGFQDGISVKNTSAGYFLKHIDSYMNPEAMINILTFRFTNSLVYNSWHRDVISKIVITCKTTEDSLYGDDLTQSPIILHLLHLLTLVGMEKPVSPSGVDYQREKVRVLKAVKEIEKEDFVLAEKISGKAENLLCELNHARKASFISFVVHVENERL